MRIEDLVFAGLLVIAVILFGELVFAEDNSYKTARQIQIEMAKSEYGIVYFWVKPCKPCNDAARALREAKKMYGSRLNVYTVNLSKNQMLAVAFGVDKVPAMHVFKNSILQAVLIGAPAKGELNHFLGQLFQDKVALDKEETKAGS